MEAVCLEEAEIKKNISNYFYVWMFAKFAEEY